MILKESLSLCADATVLLINKLSMLVNYYHWPLCIGSCW